MPRIKNIMSAIMTRVMPRSLLRADLLEPNCLLGPIPQPPLVHLIPLETAVCGGFFDFHVALESPACRLPGGQQGRRITGLHQPRRDEDQELGTSLPRVLRAKELPQNRDIAKKGYLGRVVRHGIVHQSSYGQILPAPHLNLGLGSSGEQARNGEASEDERVGEIQRRDLRHDLESNAPATGDHRSEFQADAEFLEYD